MNSGTLVTRWVIDTVKKHYADDIALIISHTTLRIEDQTPAVGYFVPLTERGYQFGCTFILNGEGFDIWAVDWARLERFADLEEYNLTCLADGEILYARTPADADRFAALQKRQAANLSDRVQMRPDRLCAGQERLSGNAVCPNLQRRAHVRRLHPRLPGAGGRVFQPPLFPQIADGAA